MLPYFHQAERGEWQRSWQVVVAGMAGMALAAVPSFTTGVLIQSLQDEFGWSRTAISAGPMIPTIVAIFVGPFIGLAVDKIGPRRIGVTGVICACISIALLSLATSSVWSWWILWATAMTFSAILIKPVVWVAAVSSLFDVGRGFALATIMCGAALTAFLVPSLLNVLDVHFGWRVACIVLGGICAVLTIPPILLFLTSSMDQDRAARRGGNKSIRRLSPNVPGVSAKEGLTSGKYMRLVFATIAITLGTSPFLLNLVPILSSFGHSRATAAMVAGLIGIGTIIGRFTGGYLLDRFNGNTICAVSSALPIASGFLLLAAPGSLPAAMGASLIFGLATGAEVDGVAYLVSRHFGLKSFGTLYGTLSGFMAMATGVGPMLVNYSYDLTNSYSSALSLQAPICLLAVVLFATLGPYRKFADAAA